MTQTTIDKLERLLAEASELLPLSLLWGGPDIEGADGMRIYDEGGHDADDAALIVAAVNALPELIEAVRERDRLREALNALVSRQAAFAHMFERAVGSFKWAVDMIDMCEPKPTGLVKSLRHWFENSAKNAQKDADTIAEHDAWIAAKAALEPARQALEVKP